MFRERNLLFLLPCILCILKTQGQDPLGFECIDAEGKPCFWYSPNSAQYEIDTATVFAGNNSLKLTSLENEYSTVTIKFPKELLQSCYSSTDTFIVTASIKTNLVATGQARLSISALYPDHKKRILAQDSLGNKKATGISRWTNFSAKVMFDTAALNMYIGLTIQGTGEAWLDNISIRTEQGISHPFECLNNNIDKKSFEKFSSPIDISNDNLFSKQQLKKWFGNFRILGLGESTHGTREFFTVKAKIIKSYVIEFGITNFAIEANLPEARIVDAYINQREKNPSILSSMYFWTWQTQEVFELVEWMRHYNLINEKKIRFFGFDMQFQRVPLENVKAVITKKDIPVFSLLETIEKYMNDRNRIDPSEATEIYGILDSLQAYVITSSSDTLDSELNQAKINNLVKDIDIIRQGFRYRIKRTLRDKLMAENIAWIADQVGKDEKLIIWAHNGHINKVKGRMGYYLNGQYGNEYRPVGLTTFEGNHTAKGERGVTSYPACTAPLGSLEYFIFSNTAYDASVLDLQRYLRANKTKEPYESLTLIRTTGAIPVRLGFQYLNLQELFDTVIHINKTSNTKLQY